MKPINVVWILFAAILTLSSAALGQAVKRNDVSGDVFIGNQRVMRLAATPSMTIGERVASVNQRLATLQGNYRGFNTERIIISDTYYAFSSVLPPELRGAPVLEFSLWKTWLAKYSSRKSPKSILIGYWRLTHERAFVGTEFHELVYIYAPDVRAPNNRVRLYGFIHPVVLVTPQDASLHGTTVYNLARQWRDNIKAALKTVK